VNKVSWEKGGRLTPFACLEFLIAKTPLPAPHRVALCTIDSLTDIIEMSSEARRCFDSSNGGIERDGDTEGRWKTKETASSDGIACLFAFVLIDFNCC